jgi:hypothetical protein
LQADNDAPSLDDFVGVRRPERDQARNGTLAAAGA